MEKEFIIIVTYFLLLFVFAAIIIIIKSPSDNKIRIKDSINLDCFPVTNYSLMNISQIKSFETVENLGGKLVVNDRDEAHEIAEFKMICRDLSRKAGSLIYKKIDDITFEENRRYFYKFFKVENKSNN